MILLGSLYGIDEHTQVPQPNMLATISVEQSYQLIGQHFMDKLTQVRSKVAGYNFNLFSLEQQTRDKIFDQFYSEFEDSHKLRMLEGDGHPAYVIRNLINGVDLFEVSHVQKYI